MTTEERRINFVNLVTGGAIVFLGGAILAEALGIAEARSLLRLWPAMLILFGLAVIADAFRGGSGGPKAVHQQPFVSPGLVLAVALVGVMSTRTGACTWTNSDTSPQTIRLVAVMGQTERTDVAPDLRSATMTSVMGRSTLDLRKADVMPGQEIVIDVFVAMGEVQIRVPREWTVDMRAIPVAGGVSDLRSREKRTQKPSDRETSPPAERPALDAPPSVPTDSVPPEGAPPRVVIRGTVMLGKLEIGS